MEIYLESESESHFCTLCHRQCSSECAEDVTSFSVNRAGFGERLSLCGNCGTTVGKLVRARQRFLECLSELLVLTGIEATDVDKSFIASKLCLYPENGGQNGCSGKTEVQSHPVDRVEAVNDWQQSDQIVAFTKHWSVAVQELSHLQRHKPESVKSLSIAESPQIKPPPPSQILSEPQESQNSTNGGKFIQISFVMGGNTNSVENFEAKENIDGSASGPEPILRTNTCHEASQTSPTYGDSDLTPSSSQSNGGSKSKSRKQHVCTICNKTCKTARELDLHTGAHLHERKYICEVCGLAYRHKKALEVHVGLHRGEAKFECEHCHKVFTQKSGLQRHLPIHTGEMAYQCDICGKRFLYNTSFNVHKFTHTKHKGFQCYECGLSFFSKSHLKRHMKTHTGVKPHVCDKCGKCFSERYNLEAHVRVHTGQKSHQCRYCDAGFNRKRKMEEHINKKHPGMCSQ